MTLLLPIGNGRFIHVHWFPIKDRKENGRGDGNTGEGKAGKGNITISN